MGKHVLSDTSQSVLDVLLDGKSREERLDAVEKISKLTDKEVVADYLVEKLSKEEDVWKRAWSLSALAEINRPDTVNVVARYINPQKEDNEWVRYWATIGLAKMNPQDLKKHLTKARNDNNPTVKAVALRLLIENDFDEQAIDELIEMIKKRRKYHSWMACKVLRSTAGHHSFRKNIEKKFIPFLISRLLDSEEYIECRFQAAMALGDIKHNRQKSIEALTQALKKEPNDWVRRACVGALSRIKQPEVQDGLLYALEDTDAEIRVRAANSLKEVLGVPNALAFIAKHLLNQDKCSEKYLNAMREIDDAASAVTLSSYLLHPDPKMSKRASKALAMLGGEEAMRTLQAQRVKALDQYTKMLDKADADIVPQFNNLIRQARIAFHMSMWMHAIIFVIGILVLGVSAYMAISSGSESFQRYVGVGGATGSLAILLTMFYKNPLSNIRNSVTGLVKVNVVFLGFVRKMNQIDATFKQLFLASVGFSLQQMKDTVQQIQDSVQHTLEEIKTHLSQ